MVSNGLEAKTFMQGILEQQKAAEQIAIEVANELLRKFKLDADGWQVSYAPQDQVLAGRLTLTFPVDAVQAFEQAFPGKINLYINEVFEALQTLAPLKDRRYKFSLGHEGIILTLDKNITLQVDIKPSKSFRIGIEQ